MSEVKAKKKVNKKLITFIAIVAIVAVGLAILLSRQAEAQKLIIEQGVPTVVEQARVETVINEITAKGEVVLKNSEKVYTETKATVEEVVFEINDVVKAGDVLLRYKQKDKDDMVDQLKAAELSLRSAQISYQTSMINPLDSASLPAKELEISDSESKIETLKRTISDSEKQLETLKTDISFREKQFETTKDLYSSGLVTKTQYETEENSLNSMYDNITSSESSIVKLKSDLQTAEASLGLSKIQYEELKKTPEKRERLNNIELQRIAVEQRSLDVDILKRKIDDFQLEIYAPIDGTIVSLSVSVGEVTMTEKVLFEIADLEDYVVKVNIKEKAAPSIKLNQEVELTGNALNKEKLVGIISKIDPVAIKVQLSNTTENMLPIEITVKDKSTILKPGYSMDAKIITDISENAIIVPVLSMITESDESFVFIVKEDNTVEKRKVQRGIDSNLYVEVIGVEEGEFIISNPKSINDGDIIRPVDLEGNSIRGSGNEGDLNDTSN